MNLLKSFKCLALMNKRTKKFKKKQKQMNFLSLMINDKVKMILKIILLIKVLRIIINLY